MANIAAHPTQSEIYAISNPSSHDTTTHSVSSNGFCGGPPQCGIEDRTFRIGRLLGTYPFLSIIIAISIVATGSMGFLNFRIESRVEDLWISPESTAYAARSASRLFPVGLRAKMTIFIGAPDVLQQDIVELMLKIDSIIKSFTYHEKGWNALCFKRNAECQMFSLLNFLDVSRDNYLTNDAIVAAMNNPGRNRRSSILPPYFISLEDVLSGVTISNTTGGISGATVTRMVYFLQRQEPDRIASKVPTSAEEVLRETLTNTFRGGFSQKNISIAVALEYPSADIPPETFVSFDYFSSLIYACIAYLLVVFVATGSYTGSRHGFWLGVSGLIGVGLAIAFGFGIASAVGLPFTPFHFVLPIYLLGMSAFGFLVMEMELRMISNARPSLPRNDKMGLTMQRSFMTIVLCMLSNFLVFAVGIGSRLPIVRSFCVFGVTSSVGIFISQILFLFGCLSAWQNTYESHASAWICCYKRNDASERNSPSLYTWLKPVFGFLASNLHDNIGKGFVFLGVTVLTGVCVYFLFSLRIVFSLRRYDQGLSQFTSGSVPHFDDFRASEASIGCVYLGDIPYHLRQSELRTFQRYLKEHASIRPRSVASWFDRYQAWIANYQKLRAVGYSNSTGGLDTSILDKTIFYQSVTKFVIEKNYEEDVVLIRKPDDDLEILTSRICFRFVIGLHPDNYSLAAENIANVAADLQLGKAYVDSNMMLEVLVQKTLANELWVLFGAYFVVLLIVAALTIQSVISALVVFVSFALLTIHTIGLISSQKISIDSMMLVTIFCYISIVSQAIFYEATVFNRLDGKIERKARLKSTLIAAGPPALACFLCAVAITIPLLDSSVESFRLILKISCTTMAVGFAHVFLFLPVALSVATPEAVSYATLRLRRRFTKQTPQSSSPGVHFDGGVSIAQEAEALELANNQVHFAARSPVQRADSVSSRVSLRFHHKNAGLRAVLHSLPSPIESVTSEEEKKHAENPQPNDPTQYDSLKNLSISAQQSEDRAEHEYTPGTQGELPDRPEVTTSSQ